MPFLPAPLDSAARLARRAGLLGLLALMVWVVGCSPKAAPAEEPVRSVKLITVQSTVVDASQEFSAEVRPRIESRLGFRVAGKLVQRRVEPGQRVRPGQLLAELDAQDFQLGIESAKAQVTSAQTNRDLAAADQKRYASLKEQNFISGAELERRDAVLKSAQAQLEQAQAQLNVQANQARYTRLLADVAGVVTAVDAEPGQVLQAGAPVLRLAQDGARDIVFAVPEDKVGMFKLGAMLKVRDWTGGQVRSGKLREIAPAADPQTRTFALKLALQGGDLPLGSTVYVQSLEPGLGGVPVIKLPTSALREQGQQTAVWVFDPASMTVKSQWVQVATADGNQAVIAAGLQPGAQVVAAGVHVLAQGQKVAVYQEKRGNGAPAQASPQGTASAPAK